MERLLHLKMGSGPSQDQTELTAVLKCCGPWARGAAPAFAVVVVQHTGGTCPVRDSEWEG